MKQYQAKTRAIFALALGLASAVTVSAQPAQTPQAGQGQGGGMGRGMGGFPGGRGVFGTVTEVSADHYTIKTDTGEVYTVHYSVNTRIMKAGAGRRGGGAARANTESDAPATPPTPLKPTDIKVGDIITAGGQMDEAGKSIGAVFIGLVDPERAKQMREMEANYGKTWLAGRITAVEGTTITIEGMVDHANHAIQVDENTSFRRRRDSITLADIQPGQQLRAEGAVKGGVFTATVVNAAEPRDPGQRPGQPGASPQPQ